MPRSVTPLVGRAAESATLLAAVKAAASGAASVVVLDGDAGVGKTRVLDELSARARADGCLSLVGHCVDLGDTPPPYLPFSEAFGRLAVQDPERLGEMAAAAPSIQRLLPGRPADSAGGRLERGELFEAVLSALVALGRAGPVLLVIEDVHWADQATRDLLGFLFTRLRSEPVAVVVSYRSDDVDRRHPLRATLAQWSRLAVVERVHLEPLPAADVRQLVALLQSAPISADRVASILTRADGNAFFAEELVAAVEHCADCQELPWQLADLLLVRLDRLSTDAREVVRAAAVAGRRVSHELLSAVVELTPSALDAALRDAVDGNVLQLTSSGRGYTFRHALLVEAVYDDLLPGQRVRIHAAYAAALRDRGDHAAAELARHAWASHDFATAYEAGIQAGDKAMDLAAPQEAMQHYRNALELAPRLADPPDDASPLVVALVDAAVTAGRSYKAMRLAQDALDQLSADAPALARARLLYAFAFAAVAGESDEQTLDATAEALRLVPADPPTPFRARLAALHAHLCFVLARPADAERWAHEAIGLARQVGLPDAATDAETTLVKLDQRWGNPAESARRLDALATGAQAAGQTASALRTRHALGSLYYEIGELDRAQAAYEHAAASALAAGRPWTLYGTESRVMVGTVQYVRGDWDAALRTLDVSRDSPPEQSRSVLVATAMAVRAGRGEIDALSDLPWLRRWWQREGRVGLNAGCAALEIYEQQARVEDAFALLDELVALLGTMWLEPWFLGRIRLSALGLMVLCAAASAPGRDGAELVMLGERLSDAARTSARRGVPNGRQLGTEGVAWLARAEAEWCRLRWLTGEDVPSEDEHLAAWERAAGAFDYGSVYECARSRARLAAVLRAAGRGAEAAEQATPAREVARRLGAEPLLGEIRRLGLTAAPRTSAPTGPAALTGRERDVLALLVQARTNRQIAHSLYISEKTVSVHVSNILAKLGVRSRNEAAALARTWGSTPPVRA